MWMAGFGQALGRVCPQQDGSSDPKLRDANHVVLGPIPPHQSACVASSPSGAVALHPPLVRLWLHKHPGHAWHFQTLSSPTVWPTCSWAFGLSSLPRQETAWDLISHQLTPTKLSCGWFMLVFWSCPSLCAITNQLVANKPLRNVFSLCSSSFSIDMCLS